MLLKLAIIFYFLIILVNGLAVLLYGEIRCWSLLGFKRLSFICFHQDNFYSLGPLQMIRHNHEWEFYAQLDFLL